MAPASFFLSSMRIPCTASTIDTTIFVILVVCQGLSSFNPNFLKHRNGATISDITITNWRITNVSQLELMHQEQPKSSIAWDIEIHNSCFAREFTKVDFVNKGGFCEVGVGDWQSMQESFFELEFPVRFQFCKASPVKGSLARLRRVRRQSTKHLWGTFS